MPPAAPYTYYVPVVAAGVALGMSWPLLAGVLALALLSFLDDRRPLAAQVAVVAASGAVYLALAAWLELRRAHHLRAEEKAA